MKVDILGRNVKENGNITLAANIESVVTFPAGLSQVIVYNSGPGAVHIQFDAIVTTSHFKLDEGKSISGFACSSIHLITPTGAPTVQYIGN